ncbi:MAG: twin-arginine translocase TatA/TatE family subunit [Deltaproteobacteria bacterium]|nr:twin-arginine translocase TatA/TatE family subunit [Deltaproteobacteria bacterium]
MFGIGLTEVIIILIVALLVVGPKKLPELAKTLGRGMAEFRRAADDFKTSIYQDEETVKSDRERGEEQRKISKIEYPEDPPITVTVSRPGEGADSKPEALAENSENGKVEAGS